MMRSEGAERLEIGDIPKLRNIRVHTSDGETIGHVGDIYYDDAGMIECVGVEGDAVGLRRLLVPVAGAVLGDDGLHLPYGRDRLDTAPDVEGDVDEARYGDVRDHYDAPTVVRHEEELAFGKAPVSTGAVRLRKWVDTEPVSATVELQREVARVAHRPVGQTVAEHDFQEDEIEIAMHAEQPVVRKHVIAKERIGIEKDVASERATIVDEVRKEHVDVQREDAPG